jgi:hypothetical protein
MSSGRVVNVLPSTVVRIRTRDGIDGFGETCPLGSTYLPAFAEGVRTALRELAPALIGVDAGNLAAVTERMDATLRGQEAAKSAVDVACWDVLGRATGLSVGTLLGGALHEAVPLYVAVPLGPADAMAAFVERERDGGIHHFQLKLGADPHDDATRVRAVLEASAVTGVLGLARREGNRRYYDVIERLVPADILAHKVPLREQLRYKLLSRYRAHGLLGIAGPDIFGGLGRAKPDPELPDSPGRTALREELIEDGDLVPVTVEGVRGKRFVLREEVELLKAPPEPGHSVAFLPPFDALVWDRALLGSLFGFEYVWELFVPPAKRRWGWYVLPILFGDRLVGRIEPRIDRAEGCVSVLDVWWEDSFDPGRAEGFVEAMRAALRAYLHFAGVSRLEWAPQLGMEKTLFLTRPQRKS